MGIFQFLVSAGALSFVAGMFIVIGTALLIGSFLAKQYRRESRTLARYGVLSLTFGVVGTMWPPFIGACLTVLIVWALSQCFI